MAEPHNSDEDLTRSEPAWLEVSLTVAGELAEAVAEVMARYIPSGVVIQSTQVTQEPDGEGHAVGPMRVCGYLPINSQTHETKQRLEEALWYLGRIRPMPEPVFLPLLEIDWAESWKQNFVPLKIGHRLLIQPPWIEETSQQRIPILIEPGMAFGTGTHPTTQLCLSALEGYLQPGAAVIDVGCGSGILSIASVKLGASQVLGVDTDVTAIESAAKNVRLNQLEAEIQLEVGSVEEILQGRYTLRSAPLVLANLLASILVRLLDAGLAELVAPGGFLILSGILDDQLEGHDGYLSMFAEIRKHNLVVRERRQLGDWVALVVQKNEAE